MSNPQQRKKVLTAQIRRPQVAKLYLEGKSQHEIAKIFNISQNTIHRDLKTIRDGWLEQSLIPFDEAMAKQLARLDWIEGESARQWAQSVEAGKPKQSFLDTILRCLEQRSKLLGLYDDRPQMQVNVQNNVGMQDLREEIARVYEVHNTSG